MESICRLCLSITINTETLSVLTEECEVYRKICTLISDTISLEKTLPNRLCQKCHNQVEGYHYFHCQITQNEAMLRQYLNDNTLNVFYKRIKDGSDIKSEINCNLENKENMLNIFNDNKDLWDKTEWLVKEAPLINKNNCISKQLEHSSDVNNLEYINEKTEHVIKEEIFLSEHEYETDHSFDDNITLSTLKMIKHDAIPMKKKNKCKSRKRRVRNEEVKIESIVKRTRNNDRLFFPEGTPDHEKKWKCLTCFEFLNTRQSLLNHYRDEHNTNDAKVHEHKVGDKPVDVKESTVTSEDGGKSYKCLKCDKVFEKKRSLSRHMVSHLEDRPFVCNICGRTYKQVSEIVRHGRVHSGFKPLVCSYKDCGFSTAYYGALRTHEKRHSPEFKYTCEKCGKGFHVKTWFEQHQNVHSGEKPYVCELCGSAFYMDKYLKTHRHTVHPEASNQKRHICIHCGLSCDNRTALNSHLKEHGVAKSFLCDICGKSLSSAEHLKFHRRMHLGVRPYSCSVCEKAFVKKSNLTLHSRVHSGERPHACAHCPKAFAQRSALVVHTRYHTGSRPYQCAICPKAFVSRSQLSVHQKTCI